MRSLALLLALTSPAAAWPLCHDGQPKAACIHDGDSGWYDGRPFRVADLSAPEIGQHARCQAEHEAGIRARDRLAAITGITTAVYTGGQIDRYGRVLVELITPVGSAADVLIAEGLALPWRWGQKARAADLQRWCGGE